MVACVKSRAMMRTVAGRFLAISLARSALRRPGAGRRQRGRGARAVPRVHRLPRRQTLADARPGQKRSPALLQPSAPMPNFGFTAAQAGDIADYLATLGPQAKGPLITISPAHPSDSATVTIYFSGTPPQSVTAVASMAMGGSTMNSPAVTARALRGRPHVYRSPLVLDGRRVDAANSLQRQRDRPSVGRRASSAMRRRDFFAGSSAMSALALAPLSHASTRG